MASPPRDSPSPRLVSLAGHHLTSFPRLPSSCTNLIASDNPFDSLSTLPTLPHLERLDLSQTTLQSFESANPQPSLKSLLIRRSPLGLEPLLTEMSLIILSDNLEIINGISVRPDQRQFARTSAASLRPHLLDGWILRALRPARLMHVRTRARKVVKLTWPAPPSPPRASPARAQLASPDVPGEGPRTVAAADWGGGPDIEALAARVTSLSKSWNRWGAHPEPDFALERQGAVRRPSVVKMRRAGRDCADLQTVAELSGEIPTRDSSLSPPKKSE